MDRIDKIGSKGYLPSWKDFLSVSTPTTGILQETFYVDDFKLQIFDVGRRRCVS